MAGRQIGGYAERHCGAYRDWWIAARPILASVVPVPSEVTRLTAESNTPTEIYTEDTSPGLKQKRKQKKEKTRKEKLSWSENNLKRKKKALTQLLEQADTSSTSQLLKLSLLMLRHHLRVAHNAGRVEEKKSKYHRGLDKRSKSILRRLFFFLFRLSRGRFAAVLKALLFSPAA